MTFLCSIRYISFGDWISTRFHLYKQSSHLVEVSALESCMEYLLYARIMCRWIDLIFVILVENLLSRRRMNMITSPPILRGIAALCLCIPFPSSSACAFTTEQKINPGLRSQMKWGLEWYTNISLSATCLTAMHMTEMQDQTLGLGKKPVSVVQMMLQSVSSRFLIFRKLPYNRQRNWIIAGVLSTSSDVIYALVSVIDIVVTCIVWCNLSEFVRYVLLALWCYIHFQRCDVIVCIGLNIL